METSLEVLLVSFKISLIFFRKVCQKLLYAFWILFPLLIGGIVSMIISNSVDYQNLIQPPLAPPSILFPIAWTVLYLLMGFSYFLYRKTYQDYKTIFIYYLQFTILKISALTYSNNIIFLTLTHYCEYHCEAISLNRKVQLHCK